MKYGKKYAESIKAFDRTKQYDAEEAMEIVINNPYSVSRWRFLFRKPS